MLTLLSLGDGGVVVLPRPRLLDAMSLNRIGVNICVCVRFILCGGECMGPRLIGRCPIYLARILEFLLGNFNLRVCGVRDVAKGECEP